MTKHVTIEFTEAEKEIFQKMKEILIELEIAHGGTVRAKNIAGVKTGLVNILNGNSLD